MRKKSKLVVLVIGALILIIILIFLINEREKQLMNDSVKKRNIITDITDLSEVQDKFVDVELEYVGSAKVGETKNNKEELFIMRGEPYSDDDLLYSYHGYRLFAGDGFSRWREKLNLYCLDYEEASYQKGEMYVMSFGRKLEWLQYNPEWYTQFGHVVNRAGLAWDDEIDPTIVYVYKFSYDVEKYGGLACMAEEY